MSTSAKWSKGYRESLSHSIILWFVDRGLVSQRVKKGKLMSSPSRCTPMLPWQTRARPGFFFSWSGKMVIHLPQNVGVLAFLEVNGDWDLNTNKPKEEHRGWPFSELFLFGRWFQMLPNNPYAREFVKNEIRPGENLMKPPINPKPISLNNPSMFLYVVIHESLHIYKA